MFGDDLELARSWIRPQLKGLVSTRTGHMAISVGLGSALLNSVKEGTVQANINSLRQWNFRTARLHGEINPYRHLLPEGMLENTLAAVADKRDKKLPLDVQLNGGIGDHLEALSLLLPWARAQNQCLNIEMSAERKHQIEPLLHEWVQVKCKRISEQGTSSLPAMALRAAICGNTQTRTKYCPWLREKVTSQSENYNLLCCWRAEGAGDKLSAHSRSVQWSLVQEFYKQVKSVNPQISIIDITKWNCWEARRMRSLGVETLDPRLGSLQSLKKLCMVNRVITIDTALVHLCAAAGTSADLLLSAFPDERWNELHRPEHSYGKFIKMWRSTQFGSWSTILASVTERLIAEV